MVINLDEVTNVTLYTGDNSPRYCTCACPACSQGKRSNRYQGNLEQIAGMFKMLPNLQHLYILGNPDPTVDVDFCHQVMMMAIETRIKVSISTSGIGKRSFFTKLLKNVPPEEVDYISLSIDSVDEKKLSMLKGRKISLKEVIENIEWLKKNGYKVKIQPTLWSSNYDEAEEIMEFFISKGVKWFSFHIGSLESNVKLPTHDHLDQYQMEYVFNSIDNILKKHSGLKIRCPYIYNNGIQDDNKWYCMKESGIKELLVILTRDGIKATHTPIATSIKDNSFYIKDSKFINVSKLEKGEFCPYSMELSGKKQTICRFVSKVWQN